jgi:hypothetical protein
MITQWQYNNHGNFRDHVKNIIKENRYSSIDIGASARYWSYPECKVIADAYPVNEKDITYFNINIENISTWKSVFDYIEINGKFDFSICSHTMEDVFNPIDLSNILSKISHRGYVAVPSKFDEFSKLYNNKYRGNAHHKQFFDIVDKKLIIFPKFSWIENDERSDKILEHYISNELTFFWEDFIPIEVFGNGLPFNSDDSLINSYYDHL